MSNSITDGLHADNGVAGVAAGSREDAYFGADPSERRLIVVLSGEGVKAYLKNTADPTASFRRLVSAEWNRDDSRLLRRIENAVYDHPEVLEDYECDVVVLTDTFLWMPREVAEDEETAALLFNNIFNKEDEDVLYEESWRGPDTMPGLLFWLCPGLPAFLRRTFPGARVSCRQALLFRRFAGRVHDAPSVFVDVHSDTFDILIFRGEEFLLGASHGCRDLSEAQYHILNCIRTAGLDAAKCEVYLCGDRDARRELLSELRGILPYVRNAMMPRIEVPDDMPVAAMICATQPRGDAAAGE